MTDRERDVMAAFARSPGVGFTPSVLARLLNLRWRGDGAATTPVRRPCPWCPVGPSRPGERCASVPRASREKAARVLRGLARTGRLIHVWPGTRAARYVLPDSEPAQGCTAAKGGTP